MSQERNVSVLSAARAALVYYDGLGRHHDPGEAEVLDGPSRALMTEAVCIIPNCGRRCGAAEAFCAEHRDHKESEPKTSLRAKLKEIDRVLAGGPWEVWTSNSFRRITGPDGADGGVLHAYNQRSDGHADLSMSEQQLTALSELRNLLPEILLAVSQ